MKFSSFGNSFSSDAGIVRLMDDLGNALSVNEGMLMLGGGNPGQIPEVQARFRQRMHDILAEGDYFERLIGEYDPPQGESRFRDALAALLRREFGWPLRAEPRRSCLPARDGLELPLCLFQSASYSARLAGSTRAR